ncbi:MAG TPA: phosphatidate cytidylyltransferase [Vicinamibacterales bacterium]
MTRVLSALVLLPVVIGTIWFLPSEGTLVLALVAALLAFFEYSRLSSALGVTVPGGIGGAAVALVCFEMWFADRTLHANWTHLVLAAAMLVIGAASVGRGRPMPGVLADAAATMFAPVYIGLPLGSVAALRANTAPDGRWLVLLLLVTIVVSDSAQYYTGRAFGRRQLSPSISPKKTVEGALGGVIFATIAMAAGGRYVFGSPVWVLSVLGAVIALLGIVGDLFESLLKRSAGVKDSSHLIPGHGGVLDRIDSWLFAAPVYYVFVRFVG